MDKKKQYALRTTNRLVIQLVDNGIRLASPPRAERIYPKYFQLLALSEIDAVSCVDVPTMEARVASRAEVPLEDVSVFVRSMIRSNRLRHRPKPLYTENRPPLTLPPTGDRVPLEQGEIALKLPLIPRLFQGQFQVLNHDGYLIAALSAEDLVAIGQFVRLQTFQAGFDAQQALLKSNAISESRLEEILNLLHSTGLLSQVETVKKSSIRPKKQLTRSQACKENFARQALEQDAKEELRRQRTGVYRPKVIPVTDTECVPVALGLIYAYAKNYDEGCLDEFYDFRLDWFWDDDRVETFATQMAIYLFSNYLWSHEKNIAVSETVKRLSPGSITIHGGPDTPKYAEDAQKYLASYPHVDIIVRGEGEATLAVVLDKLRSVIGQNDPDLSVLAGVEGVTYRHGDKIIRNPDRERIENLDEIPSPYLMGLFDAYIDVPQLHVTIETNRGCPYGCTFCDWGSATTSKIRKFDLDRVMADLEWCSRAKVKSISQADANFGVFERDVTIAEKVAELKKTTGFPETFGGSYAKNSTKYLQKIIKVLAEAGILAQGVLSLQTMDDKTLNVINRSNIKVEKYDALATEMSKANLQLSVELMMGLPGATLQSFKEDLQQCIDREIQARINHTTMLVNSPMNNPLYREEHQIETGTELGPGKMPVLASTATYSHADIQIMSDLRLVYSLLDNFGVFRLVSRFVRQQTGMLEMELYNTLLTDAALDKNQTRWPVLSTFISLPDQLMAAPYSWSLLLEELGDYLVHNCGVIDDSALDCILTAQRAILPTHGRVYPVALELQHDVVMWHTQMLAAKATGHQRDWQTIVPPLSSFVPGILNVDDPNGDVTKMLGCALDLTAGGVNWDLISGMDRARANMDFDAVWKPDKAEVIRAG